MEKVTHQISKNNFDAGIIVVDDGSSDGTAELIKDFGKIHTNVALLNRHEKKDWLRMLHPVFSFSKEKMMVCFFSKKGSGINLGIS